ncbi:MAG: SPOR domain-containing protein [Pedobacter sp.]
MKIRLVVVCCFVSAGLSAQTRGRVTIEKDPLIDSLIAKRLELSIAPPKATVSGVLPSKPGVIVAQMGYRVQVFYGSDRRQVFSQQAMFNGLYPAHNTYITYKQPNYYLRVGDFRTRLDAQRFMNELRPTFPTLFIFREKINAPSLDYSNDR